MKRLIVTALLLAALLCGCAQKSADGGNTDGGNTDAAPETPMVSMYDLQKEMLAKDSAMPEMMTVSGSDENAAELFAYLSDIEYEKVEGYFLAYAADGSAYEVAVVALRDAAEVPALKASLETHVQGRVSLYKSYAPDQVERAEKAIITDSGRYVALIMCEDQSAVKAAFESGVK